MTLQALSGTEIYWGLDFSESDFAVLIGLGKRLGNWLTATSGGTQLFELLNEDASIIVRRRGLLDRSKFLHTWADLTLFTNGGRINSLPVTGRALTNEESTLTIIMLCIVAALDQIAKPAVVTAVCRQMVVGLLDNDIRVDDKIRVGISTCIHAWRSAAAVRGVNLRCADMHASFLTKKLIRGGHIPEGDVSLVVDFLIWLLSGMTTTFTTASADVAYLGLQLSHLGFELSNVTELGYETTDWSCKLIYNPESISMDRLANNRGLSTTIALDEPERACAVLYLDSNLAARCKDAWCTGQRAAKYISVRLCDECLRSPTFEGAGIYFDFTSSGTPVPPHTDHCVALAAALGLALNDELSSLLRSVLAGETETILVWLLFKATEQPDALQDSAIKVLSAAELGAFSSLQAFFMGYYYQCFLGIVDTSKLRLRTVLGTWGYRSNSFLLRMRNMIRTSSIQYSDHVCWSRFEHRGQSYTQHRFSRESVLIVLSTLFCGKHIDVPVATLPQERCLGIIGERCSVLVNSLLGIYTSPEELAKFTLLDVDLSNVPRNRQGLVYGGVQRRPEVFPFELSIPGGLWTQNIEPDWEDENPDKLVLHLRISGHSVGTVNPALADQLFCYAHGLPVLQRQLETTKSSEEDEIGQSTSATSTRDEVGDIEITVDIRNDPCRHYAVVAWYFEDADRSLHGMLIHDDTPVESSGTKFYACALQSFFPANSDPGKLMFEQGDILEVIQTSELLSATGHCLAKIKGTADIGLVPLDYLETSQYSMMASIKGSTASGLVPLSYWESGRKQRDSIDEQLAERVKIDQSMETGSTTPFEADPLEQQHHSDNSDVSEQVTRHDVSAGLDTKHKSVRDRLLRFAENAAIRVDSIGIFLKWWEPEIPPNAHRLRWRCVCGKQLYDDYVGCSIAELQQLSHIFNTEQGNSTIKLAGAPSTLTAGPQMVENQRISTQATTSALQSAGGQGTSEGVETMTMLRRGEQLANRQVNPDADDPEEAWMWSIFHTSKYGKNALALDFRPPPSDKDLFMALKQTYRAQKNGLKRVFALRGVTKICHVKFSLPSEGVNIEEYDDWPLSGSRPPWYYLGCPAKPLIEKNYLMNLWHNPTHTDKETYLKNRSKLAKLGSWIFHFIKITLPYFFTTTLLKGSPGTFEPGTSVITSRIDTDPAPGDIGQDRADAEAGPSRSEPRGFVSPRMARQHGPQIVRHDGRPGQGWGLYFEEGFLVHHLLMIALIFYTIGSIVFVLTWFLTYRHVGSLSGWGVTGAGSWLTSYLSLLVTVWFKWAD